MMRSFSLAGKVRVQFTSAFPAVAVGILLGVVSISPNLQLPAVAVIAALAMVLPASYLILQKPSIGLLLLIYLLPVHSLALLVTMGWLQLPHTFGNVFRIWKEALLLLLITAIIVVRRPPQQRLALQGIDLLILLFLSLETLYLLVPSDVVNLTVKLYGLRTNSLFFLVYFVGRFLPLTRRRTQQIVYGVVAIGFIASVVAVVQSLLLPEDALLHLGFAHYLRFLGSDGDSLPTQFFRDFVSRRVVRASSIYINPLEFAFAELIAIPLAITFLIRGSWSQTRRYILMAVLILMIGGFLLAFVRSAVLGLIAGMGCSLLLTTKRVSRRLVVAIGLTVGASLLMGLVLDMGELIYLIVRRLEPSTQWHFDAWANSLAIISEHPFGQGLGTAGPISLRFLKDRATISESWYLQLGVETGILTSLLFVAIVAAFLKSVIEAYNRSYDEFHKITAAGLLASCIALSFTGLFLHVWAYFTTSYTFWLLAGMVLGNRT